MKLLGCHIANFGCFHDYDLTFTEGLNIILQANGWGKSTLAAFVKAMLYGFSRKRVRNVTENERLRYKPWQGGVYGGSLDFEVQGRELRVMRTFGATPAKDTLKIVDIKTGRSVLPEIQGDVGEWLFGLDANAFQKSVYVVQNGFGFDGSVAGLRNRMNALVNEADDVAGFDKAQARLDERRRYYSRTGNRGAIADATRDIAKLVETSQQDEARIATLRQLQDNMGSYDDAIAELDAQIAEVQKAAEQQQAQDQERAALQKVARQLEERRQDARNAYTAALSDFGGKVPTADKIDQARQLLVDRDRALNKAAEARKAVEEAQLRRDQLLEAHPKGLPNKASVRRVREQLSTLQGLDAALERERHAAAEDVEDAVDPQLLMQADTVVAKYTGAAQALKESREARKRADEKRRNWMALRDQVASLQAEVRELESTLPDDAPQRAEDLRASAQALRSGNLERGQAAHRVDELQLQLKKMQEAANELPDGFEDEESAMASLDEAAGRMRDAIEAANEARAANREAEKRVDDARIALDGARKAAEDHQAALEQASKGLPMPAIACIAGGVLALIAGAITGPTGGVSFALYGIGAALIVLGLVLSRKGPSQEYLATGEELAKTREDAQAAYNEACEEARLAAERSTEASGLSDSAREGMTTLVLELFPGETFDDASIEAQIPVLKQRLASHREQRLKTAELEQRLRESQDQLAEIEQQINEVLKSCEDYQYPNNDLVALAEQLERDERELSARMALVKDRSARLDQDLKRLFAASVAPRGWKASRKSSAVSLDDWRPKGIAEFETRERKAALRVDTYVGQLSEALKAFGYDAITADDMAVGVERLGAATAATRKREAAQKAQQSKLSAREAECRSLRSKVDEWARGQGLGNASELTDAWFANVEKTTAAYERMAWELRRAEDDAKRSELSAEAVRRQARDACVALGVTEGTQALRDLDELSQKLQEVEGLKQAMLLAQDEQQTWSRQHGDALNAAARMKTGANGPAERLALLTRQRDAMMRERAQREEQQNSILESLERLPVVHQELALLSKKKQLATTNLFTIQKTAEYLQRARDGLDGRYLGDLGDRFGDYANAWLNSEQVDAVVDGEFGVALYEDGSAHDVVGYSTGYQDLLDVCFRMALVDTIFQAEPPFLVMDDPFANLDEEKLARALQLLESLAQKYQIIYFTCHPSRIEARDVTNAQMAFTLPKQQARRELPRARARREAQERAEAQAKLVASYEVVPVTQGRGSIKPVGRRHTISNNLFSLAFEMDDASGTRNNSFEVHFIDGQGRVLCDRQTVEVIDGHVVPEKVRFSLSTRDDSGSTYDLIVHEDGREPAQLAARIPFAAEVSFAADDFGF